ncbi:hypothetical protein POM88_051269 [Heracleum sosnowskyi]|uniref:Ribonuclease n=1 Tax=Heracleum sosnowskyi TaxID=360622 RepID=A0AAD8H0A3_9APIA|nr:hypothetical protein POM88_051269 [Heracleum sosnowskyi]
MASRVIMAKAMLKGIVKAVPSGDTLVIMEMGDTASTGIPPERTIILSSLMAPKLARRGGNQTTDDEPWAWQSREFLRNICIGKEVKFQVDYTLAQRGLDFGTVFLGDKNVAFYVVAQGWAKLKTVRNLDKDKGEFSPYLKELKKWEDKAKENGVGCWSKATAGAVRDDLPPSLVSDPDSKALTALVEEYGGSKIKAIVEYVRDGSTLHVYLLPDYHHVRVFVAGVQAPSTRNWIAEPVKTEANGKPFNGSRGPLTSAKKIVASSTSVTEDAPEDLGRESKHFTEIRVLHREVRIVLKGVDERGKLIGSVFYLDGQCKDLAEQLVENGLARYVDCGLLLPPNAKRSLKSSELVAKKSQLKMWKNYRPPPTDLRAIEDYFSGEVVEVVSGDCIVVATTDPDTDLVAKRRVYLSSIRCPRSVNGKAKEVLKKHLLKHQVHLSLEYSRKVNIAEGPGSQNRHAAERVKEFGSVHFELQSGSAEDFPLAPPAGYQRRMTNIAELMVAHGLYEVIKHRDFEPTSDHYDELFDAEYNAIAAKVGMHSDNDRPYVSNGQAKHSDKKYADSDRPYVSNGQAMHSDKKYVDGPYVSNGQTIRRKPIEKSQIQDNSVKGQEVSGSPAIKSTPKEELQVVAKEVLGGGRFYVQAAADQKAASIIQQKLASLRLQEAPAIGSYNPKKGDLVIAQFSQDNSWYRATIVDAPKGAVRSAKAKFEVFYIDYGTREFVPYSRLRPSDCYSLPSSPGLAKLCSLAHVKVPGWKEDYGKEAACCLSNYILHGEKKFKAIVEERDNSGGEVEGYSTGTNHIVTLMDTKAGTSINAIMLKEGYARLEKREQDDKSVKQTIDKLKAYQNEARKERLGMWKNGDINSDNDDNEEEKASS